MKQNRETIFNYIVEQKAVGHSPTTQELCRVFNYSPSTLHYHLQCMQKDGLIRISLIPEGQTRRREIEVTAKNSITMSAECVSVPFVNTRNQIVDRVLIHKSLLCGDECFIYQLQNNCMKGQGILDGDYVLVSKDTDVQNGDIIAAMIGENITIRQYFNENEFVRLQPANDYMDAIYVVNCTILGKVIGVHRRFESP